MKASHPSMTPGHRGKKRNTTRVQHLLHSFSVPTSPYFPLFFFLLPSECVSLFSSHTHTHTPFSRRLLYYLDLGSSPCRSPELQQTSSCSSITANGSTCKPAKYSQLAVIPNVADNQRALNRNIKQLQWNMTLIIAWKCFSACYFIRRCPAFSMFSLHQSQSATTSMGCADVPDLVLCYATEGKKFLLLFLPSHFSLSLSVSRSLSFALKSNQLLGFLFMSPGSDALASKLCKCILPVKLKPSLLVLRGLLHRVLHHSLGSGPSHFPP